MPGVPGGAVALGSVIPEGDQARLLLEAGTLLLTEQGDALQL